jgi:preprotein translocase subunit SecB
MTETDVAAKEADTPKLSLVRIYLKDISLEAPNSPAALLRNDQWNPRISLDYRVQLAKLSDDTHDVVLTVTASAADEQKTLFLIEIQQGGVFQISNVKKQNRLNRLLNVRCPNILFPYVSETIDSLVVKAGFPPLMLAPLNFRGHYEQLAASRSKGEQPPNEALN